MAGTSVTKYPSLVLVPIDEHILYLESHSVFIPKRQRNTKSTMTQVCVCVVLTTNVICIVCTDVKYCFRNFLFAWADRIINWAHTVCCVPSIIDVTFECTARRINREKEYFGMTIQRLEIRLSENLQQQQQLLCLGVFLLSFRAQNLWRINRQRGKSARVFHQMSLKGKSMNREWQSCGRPVLNFPILYLLPDRNWTLIDHSWKRKQMLRYGCTAGLLMFSFLANFHVVERNRLQSPLCMSMNTQLKVNIWRMQMRSFWISSYFLFSLFHASNLIHSESLPSRRRALPQTKCKMRENGIVLVASN